MNTKDEQIRNRAYQLWESQGRPHGRHDEHWHQAAGELQPGAEGESPKDPHPGMLGDGTEEQNLNQPGDPSARITQAEVDAAFGSAKNSS